VRRRKALAPGEVVFDAILEPTHSDSRDEGSNENL